MTRFLLFLASVWLYRWRLLLPMLLCGAVATAWVLSRPISYEATATLQLNLETTRSPLLQDITKPGHDDVLLSVLRSEALLQDTHHQTGVLLNAHRLDLQVLNEKLLKLSYTTSVRDGLEQALDTLAVQFIHELLSPERFRTEQQLQTLELRMHTFKKQLDDVQRKLTMYREQTLPQDATQRQQYLNQGTTLEFQEERLLTQIKLVREEYEMLLKSHQQLVPQSLGNSISGVLWFAEPTTVSDPLDYMSEQFRLIRYSLLFGLFLGVLSLVWRFMQDDSVHNDEDIIALTGIGILGHLPNFGEIEVREEGPLLKMKEGAA